MTTSNLPPEIPHGSVVITPPQMYEEMREIGQKVDRLITAVDPALTEIREDILESKAHRKELEGRLRVVESRPVVTPRAMWAGAGVLIAALGLIATVAIAVIQ